MGGRTSVCVRDMREGKKPKEGKEGGEHGGGERRKVTMTQEGMENHGGEGERHIIFF